MSFPTPSDAPLTGEETTSRHRVFSVAAHADGQMRIGYFRAHRSELITKVRMACTTAAAATPTLIRVGIYQVAVNGDLTLVASTASDTSLLTAVQEYEKALSAPWQKKAGVWYAASLIVKTAAASPAIAAESFGSASMSNAAVTRPRLAALLPSQTDLPSSISSGSLSSGQFIPYFYFEP